MLASLSSGRWHVALRKFVTCFSLSFRAYRCPPAILQIFNHKLLLLLAQLIYSFQINIIIKIKKKTNLHWQICGFCIRTSLDCRKMWIPKMNVVLLSEVLNNRHGFSSIINRETNKRKKN